MAHADRKHSGPGSQGKKTGGGAMTELKPGLVGENETLQNRDKKQHSDARGQDGKWLQSEQRGETGGTATNK